MACVPIVACGLVVLAGCSAESIDGAAPIPNGSAAAPADETVLHLRIVDTQSAPLVGMVPYATEGPSLLSKTVSQGAPTGANGEGQVAFPKDQWVYVRATDPSGNLIAVDYVELQPADVPESDEPVDLVMGATASVSATLQRENGDPINSETAELLMIHPAHGQWWRAESDVGDAGNVEFAGVPAGVFVLKLQLGDTTAATFREVVLTGGELKNLGVVSPQPSE